MSFFISGVLLVGGGFVVKRALWVSQLKLELFSCQLCLCKVPYCVCLFKLSCSIKFLWRCFNFIRGSRHFLGDKMDSFKGRKQNLVDSQQPWICQNVWVKCKPVFLCWLLLSGPCPHPVEMDESMTSSSLDLAWPPSCKQCSGPTETTERPQEHGCEQVRGAAHDVVQWRLPESQYPEEPRAACHAAPQPRFMPPTHSGQMNPPHPAGVWHHGLREQPLIYERDLIVNHRRGLAGPNYPQDRSVEAESLEHPLPLMSDRAPSRYPAARMPGQCCVIIRNMKHYMYCICPYIWQCVTERLLSWSSFTIKFILLLLWSTLADKWDLWPQDSFIS